MLKSRRNWPIAVVGLAVGSIVFGTGCELSKVRTIVAGIDQVARALDGVGQDDDMSFGEWLSNELDD